MTYEVDYLSTFSINEIKIYTLFLFQLYGVLGFWGFGV